MSSTATALRGTKLDAALDLARAGFPVFPLIPNGKTPGIENWRNLATTDEQQLTLWFAGERNRRTNIGVQTDRYLVVDVDPRNGGDQTLSGLALTEDFPDTWLSKTAGGGTHMIYSLPPHTSVKGGTDVLGRGIDIKSHGGLIVAPGSAIDGRIYEWAAGYSPNERPITPAPQWLIDRCAAPRRKTRTSGTRVIEEDEQSLELAEAYLAGTQDVIQGGRDNEAFKVAAGLYDFGISRETCFSLMLEWNEMRCSPPLDMDAIERVVWSAQKNRDNSIGAKHPDAPGFDVYEMPDTIGAKPAPTGDFFTPAKRFAPADIPPRPWVVPGFACRARVTMLAGPGGVAKSTYLLMLAVAVAAQRDDICGFKVPKRCPVAVWNQEDDLEEMQRRLAAVMASFDVDWEDIEDNGKPLLYLNSGVDNPLMLATRTIEGAIRPTRQIITAAADIKAKGIGLVVLDPLVELHEAVENDNVQMRAVVSIVREVAVRGDCAVVLAAHTKKPPQASSDGFAGEMDAARGASSQFGVIRIGATLFNASPKDAKRWRMEGAHLDHVRLDIAKNNLARRTGEPIWFKRQSVQVGGADGESVGVLRPVSLSERMQAAHFLPELVARTIADSMAENEWHSLSSVQAAMTPEDIQRMPDGKNRSRIVETAFDGADEIETNFGRLKRKSKVGQGGGVLFLLIPHIPQNGGEELLN
jgi:hypothetical protein